MCKPPTITEEHTDKKADSKTQRHTKQSKRSLVLKSIQRWNRLPFNVRAKGKNNFKEI